MNSKKKSKKFKFVFLNIGLIIFHIFRDDETIRMEKIADDGNSIFNVVIQSILDAVADEINKTNPSTVYQYL